jgi:hypothetical protein
MRVVSNTSPLQYLHAIHHLAVLEQLYGHIVVPQAVMAELDTGRQAGYDVPDCRAYPWMIPDTVAIPAVLRLITNLGAGEAEALALALTTPTDLVLLDDALARQVAASQGIRYTGTIGILIQAKHQGLVTAVMPLVDAMQHAGFRVSDALKATLQRMTTE